ncbi:hypothetical protein ACRDNQ_01215 [Palleronia sp. KMU-117]|uniref:hypothetical protein n=1 Tax=Palleronia sp. KMU-117 TaxID=3434108 RepID=UPI003D7084FF
MPFDNAPDFFVKLHAAAMAAGADLTAANRGGYVFELAPTKRCIDARNLSQAAAKYRLAKAFRSLTLEGYPESSNTPQHYSAQVMMSLSVVAFEAYCRLFDEKWHRVYFDIISSELATAHCATFNEIPLDEKFFVRLKRAQDEKLGANLIAKIEEFEGGEVRNLYAVAVGFRNAFSHGRLGTLEGTAEVGPCLRNFILEAIKLDCEQRFATMTKK